MTLLSDVPERALAVYAHPNDPEVSCGGTLAAWTAAGAEVHVLVCAAGDKGTSDPDADTADLARRRADEARAAAAELGLAATELLGIPDGELENDLSLRRAIVATVRRVRPDVVVCPDPTALLFGSHYVNHRDHRVVGFATLDAVAPAAAAPHYFPDAGRPHHTRAIYLSGTLEPDAWVDITPTVDRKAAALARHESQVGEPGEWLRDAVRERAVEAGRRAGVRYAEGYRVVYPSG